MTRMSDFKRRLKQLSFELPKSIFFEEKKEGIRIASKSLMSAKIKGKRGFIAYNNELTQPFVMAFGAYSKKRIELSDEEFLLVAEGKPFNSRKEGDCIAFYKNFPVCVVSVKNSIAYPSISRGFKRKIKNFLKNKS